MSIITFQGKSFCISDYVYPSHPYYIYVGLWPDGSRYETNIGLWPLAVKFWYRVKVMPKP